jgi:hypothetical protein
MFATLTKLVQRWSTCGLTLVKPTGCIAAERSGGYGRLVIVPPTLFC